jgi:hypothetical protein
VGRLSHFLSSAIESYKREDLFGVGTTVAFQYRWGDLQRTPWTKLWWVTEATDCRQPHTYQRASNALRTFAWAQNRCGPRGQQQYGTLP